MKRALFDTKNVDVALLVINTIQNDLGTCKAHLFVLMCNWFLR